MFDVIFKFVIAQVLRWGSRNAIPINERAYRVGRTPRTWYSSYIQNWTQRDLIFFKK